MIDLLRAEKQNTSEIRLPLSKVSVPINVIYSEHISPQGRYEEWLANRPDGFQQYRKAWNELPKRFDVPRFPLNLDIEPTNICNLHCPFCYRTLAIQKNSKAFESQGNLTMELFCLILEQITENGKCMVPAIKLTHRGEPLLNQNLPEFVRMAKEAGAIDVMVNTNGTQLTQDLGEKLLDAGLDRILFSFDSPRREQYEAIRVGASYDRVLQNVRRFVAIRNKMQNKVQTLVRVGMVVTEDTAPYVQEFVDLFEPVADVISFNRVHKEIEIDDHGGYWEEGTYHECKNNMFADSQLWQRMTINWDGEAEICCENYKQEYTLGNIQNTPVVEIWNGKRFNTVRALHKEGKWWAVPQCRKCTIPWMK